MAVEEVRLRLRRKLETMLGEDETDLLMDRPPGGWGDLVTNRTMMSAFDALERRFDSVDHRFDSVDQEFKVMGHQLESLEHRVNSRMDQGFRDQTWKLVTALLATMSVVIAVFGVLLVIVSR